MQPHLRHFERLSGCSHYFAKRLFQARARLNLFSTVCHLTEHRALLSVIGQRVVTDIIDANPPRPEAE